MNSGSRYCPVCNLNLDEIDDPAHNSSKKHRFNFLLFEWNKYRKALVKNRHGVEVSIDINRKNGFSHHIDEESKKGNHILKITPAKLQSYGNKLSFLCKVKNCRNNGNVIITGVTMLHPYPLYSLHDLKNNLQNGKFLELLPAAEYIVLVNFTSGENIISGTYKIPISFNLQTVSDNPEPFSIARQIIISVEETIDELVVADKSPFTANDWPPNVEIYPPTKGQRYPDFFSIPKPYLNILKGGLEEFRGMTPEDYRIFREIRHKLEPGYLTESNYRDFWHITLWVEEMGQMLGLQRYNMENVRMDHIDGDLLELNVPGLAEKRPSVIVGDMIDIRVHSDSSNRGYRGIIKRVNDKTVHIAYVDEELLNYIKLVPSIELDVRFILSRLPIERQHLGVEQVCSIGMVPSLFGHHRTRHAIGNHYTINRYFNSLIQHNREQCIAVTRILNGSSKSLPYIVFGPPGTGKTITIVEAILQLKAETQQKILVCAPANAACDMLTEKLSQHCSKKELIRIMSETVDTTTCHQQVLKYSNYLGDGVFAKLTPSELSQYRIIVTTLILVGRYSRKYHPDVVFIDEAAQASEPEADIGISMVDVGMRVVLAGDPKQLGPSLSSRIAEKYGLGVSLLERLMSLAPYNAGDPNYITMLKLNFRSHANILKLPNELFYGGQLKAVSEKAQNDPISQVNVYKHIIQTNSKTLTKSNSDVKGAAIEFCSVMSKESREGRSPSYYNSKEVDMVIKYVHALLSLKFPNESDNVTEDQIGIVTPYARQVQKVKNKLRYNSLENVEVGTTETFQGREKRIIIITTVRAQADLLLYDKKYNLGFVKHEKRFNVALTRAMSKLIVIGCPHVLGYDPKWVQFIELCGEYGTYCGAPFARRDNDTISEITKRLDEVNFIDKQYQN